MPRLLAVILLVAATVLGARAQSELSKIGDLSLAEGQYGDADSFHATDGKTDYHFRLYLVDAPETDAADPSLARRVREQTRYFGLASPADTLRFGHAAAARTRELLARPFTAYTAGARGLGRSTEPRIYAFIITADGQDLAEQLVREGLARAYGVGRVNPAGITQEEQRAHLADLELSAGLARRGIWAESDPEKLAAARAEERKDSAELAAVSSAARQTPVAAAPGTGPVDLNTATVAELDALPGVGPALARRIVAARPFRVAEDLDAVAGVGPAMMAKLLPLITVAPAP